MEMKRRYFLGSSAMLSVAAALQGKPFGGPVRSVTTTQDRPSSTRPLIAPAEGQIPVAFLISNGAVVIDFCGPWEVFQDTTIPDRKERPFRLYTVAETAKPIRTSGGMQVIPDYTFENVPDPKILVIPAQRGQTSAMLDFIRRVTKATDLTMSICVGANVLASTGLLSGKSATTHHDSYRTFGMAFADIDVKRGVRYVEDGNLATSGGLTSGIDLALHVVERYFGRDVAKATAYQMEYQGQGWTDVNSNVVYTAAPHATEGQAICVVCGMQIPTETAPNSSYKGKKYYFCTSAHKERFDATPEKFLLARETE
jgi:putative intracellular protease/amidase/YHS domain-containing protein